MWHGVFSQKGPRLRREVEATSTGQGTLTKFDVYSHAALGGKSKQREDGVPEPGTWCRTMGVLGGSRSRLAAVSVCSAIARALNVGPRLPRVLDEAQPSDDHGRQQESKEDRICTVRRGGGGRARSRDSDCESEMGQTNSLAK